MEYMAGVSEASVRRMQAIAIEHVGLKENKMIIRCDVNMEESRGL